MRLDRTIPRLHLVLLLAFAVPVLLRLFSLGAYPLMDTTEARYGEMVRLMVTTNDWLVPQFQEGVPFWGKPPLAFWASALSAKVFGINEFALRLPSIVFSLLTLMLCASLIRPYRGLIGGLTVAMVSSTTVLGFIAMGAVWTDVALMLATTLIMVGVWQCVQQGLTSWAWAPFIGAGLAMLAKGPVGIVIPGLAVFAWCLMSGSWRALWDRLPWVRGSLLSLCIFAPWYVAAELKNPGFLNYFLVGEHVLRFIDPGWAGDLYGQAHDEVPGTIWWFGFAALFPWSAALFALPTRLIRRSHWLGENKHSLARYLLCWILAPLVLFTPARNILGTYILPALPAFAVWVSLWLTRDNTAGDEGTSKIGVPVMFCAALLPAIFSLALLMHGLGKIPLKSQKTIAMLAEQEGKQLCYLDKVPFSGAYYSGGTAKVATPDCPSPNWIVGTVSGIENFQKSENLRYSEVYKNSRYAALASNTK